MSRKLFGNNDQIQTPGYEKSLTIDRLSIFPDFGSAFGRVRTGIRLYRFFMSIMVTVMVISMMPMMSSTKMIRSYCRCKN